MTNPFLGNALLTTQSQLPKHPFQYLLGQIIHTGESEEDEPELPAPIKDNRSNKPEITETSITFKQTCFINRQVTSRKCNKASTVM